MDCQDDMIPQQNNNEQRELAEAVASEVLTEESQNTPVTPVTPVFTPYETNVQQLDTNSHLPEYQRGWNDAIKYMMQNPQFFCPGGAGMRQQQQHPSPYPRYNNRYRGNSYRGRGRYNNRRSYHPRPARFPNRYYNRNKDDVVDDGERQTQTYFQQERVTPDAESNDDFPPLGTGTGQRDEQTQEAQ